jgi:dTDP-4-amino-4,6-dideoxygalactose transaminase
MGYVQFVKPNIKLSMLDLLDIQESIESGWFCNSNYVSKLERHFRNTFNVKFAIACSNATSGLIIAFKALNIKNKRVAIPAFTWPSTLYALECNGNIPVWCDINKETWNIDFETVLKRNDAFPIDAVIPVDVFGSNSDLEINQPVIYDAAHGYGLPNLGNRGDIEVVSLSFTKPITAMQGGMILTNSRSAYLEAKELVALSAKMCEINAYIALKEIKNYKSRIVDKLDCIDLYKKLIYIPYETQKTNNYSTTFSILLESKDKRDRIAKRFKEDNIEVKIYYEPLIRGLLNTEEVYSRIISLPTYKDIIEEIPRICKHINEA